MNVPGRRRTDPGAHPTRSRVIPTWVWALLATVAVLAISANAVVVGTFIGQLSDNQRANCKSFDNLRDAEVAIFLRAYGGSSPAGARKLAQKYGYPVAIVPRTRSLQAQQQTPAQRHATNVFFADAIRELAAAECATA